MPWWVIPYVAGTLALTGWGHRHALRTPLRRLGPAAALAWIDLLGALALALPGLAYWGLDIVGLAGRTTLAVLLAVGVALVLAHAALSLWRTWRDPRLSRRRRWIIGGLVIAMALLGNGLDAWWGAQALADAQAHAHA
ncbi:hypothetical protein [Massilia sp. 9096]|uniref:hypothetical protein n=1 Tax=Massilia sp. 9096 TaxID=1500894 RepID=UPI0005687751|nr:hypothetical protein [Massilia sp. 9096]